MIFAEIQQRLEAEMDAAGVDAREGAIEVEATRKGRHRKGKQSHRVPNLATHCARESVKQLKAVAGTQTGFEALLHAFHEQKHPM